MSESGQLHQEISKRVAKIEQVIQQYLPQEEGLQQTVLEAMNYSLLAGGKRIRPMLMEEVFQLYGGTSKAIEPFMVALEMIHTYSLVHDDLPAMDDDEYRRGRKTTHVVYGECMAILAGDGLLNLAFETALTAMEVEQDSYKILRALRVLAHKAGVYGMIGGQVADIEAEDQNGKSTKEQLLFIHEHKTAALIQSAMMIGAILADAPEEEIASVEEIAYEVGIAFQIQDDILDVTSSMEVLGKPIGSDLKNGKTTYVTLEGLERAKVDVRRMTESAMSGLEQLSGENQFLVALLKQMITREK